MAIQADTPTRPRLGCTVPLVRPHIAVDDNSRLAYSEIHDDEKVHRTRLLAASAGPSLASHCITVSTVLTGSGSCDRSSDWIQAILDSTAGYISTTITGATPRRAASHPSPASTTCQDAPLRRAISEPRAEPL